MKFPLHKIISILILMLYVASFSLMTISGDVIQEQGTDGRDTTYIAEPDTAKYVTEIIFYVLLSAVLFCQLAASFFNKEKIVLYVAIALFSVSFAILLPILLESFHGKTYLLKEVAWQYYCFMVLQAVLLVSTDIKNKEKNS